MSVKQWPKARCAFCCTTLTILCAFGVFLFSCYNLAGIVSEPGEAVQKTIPENSEFELATYTPELLDSLLEDGYRVLILAVANWDATAVLNERRIQGGVINDQIVKHNLAILRLDYTDKSVRSLRGKTDYVYRSDLIAYSPTAPDAPAIDSFIADNQSIQDLIDRSENAR